MVNENYITVQLYVTEKRRVEPINVVFDSNAVGIKIELMDVTLPESGVTAEVITQHESFEHPHIQRNLSVEENVVFFFPETGIFAPGSNKCQFVIRTNEGALRSFVLNLRCDVNLEDGDTPSTVEEVMPLVERAEAARNALEGALDDIASLGDRVTLLENGSGGSGGTGGNVVLDTTLTKAGFAAEAKAVGTALAKKYEKPISGIPKNHLASGVIPTTLPNPKAITFNTGSGTVTYDGSAAMTVTIPQSSGGGSATMPTLTVGSVTTGAAGSSASAEIVPTDTGYALNMSLPRGNTGDTPTLRIGTVTTGAAGSNASADLVAVAGGYRLDMSIPKGADGAMPTLSIGTVTTGTAAASITNSGSTYKLNLTIPSGEGGVAIDTTLTQAGQAADAKVTGDAIGSLNTELTELKNSLDGVRGAADRLAGVLGIL